MMYFLLTLGIIYTIIFKTSENGAWSKDITLLMTIIWACWSILQLAQFCVKLNT